MNPQNLQEHPTLPFQEQQQEVLGLESQMNPRPDYGEQFYRGSARVQGKSAVITGGASGMRPAMALPSHPFERHIGLVVLGVFVGFLNEINGSKSKPKTSLDWCSPGSGLTQ